MYLSSIVWLFLARLAQSQLASRCSSISPSGTSVACVSNYAAVMPLPFNRTVATTNDEVPLDSFRLTAVPADPSFDLVKNATFIVFDETRGQQILTSSPTYEVVFATRNDSVHEAPIYVPFLNSIIFSLPHQGIYEQQIINLTATPPTLSNYTTTPPVYAVNGGKLYNGTIYWAVEAGVPFPNPSNTSDIVLQAPGIYALNPNTSTTTTLVNNYFGTQLNSPNDLWVDSVGDIFFTDSWYGYGINVSAIYPPLRPQTYRFRPSTGHLSVLDDTIAQPNGIAFSADEKTAFVTDTGVTDFSMPPPDGQLPRYGYNRYGGNAVYAFDLVDSPVGKYFVNKRPIYAAEEFAEDGFHVSAEGYLIGAAGFGVDILSQWGELLVRITTDFLVNNIQFVNHAGGAENSTQSGGSDLWLFGEGSIAKVGWGLTGIVNE